MLGKEEDNLDRRLLQSLHLGGTALGRNWARNKLQNPPLEEEYEGLTSDSGAWGGIWGGNRC